MARDINWTIVIILIISLFTFVTGFLLNYYTDATEGLRSEIARDEKELSSMESQKNLILDFDVGQSNLADLLLAEASINAIEYEIQNSTLTNVEREEKLKVIKKNLELAFKILNNTYTAQIQSRFEFENVTLLAFA